MINALCLISLANFMPIWGYQRRAAMDCLPIYLIYWTLYKNIKSPFVFNRVFSQLRMIKTPLFCLIIHLCLIKEMRQIDTNSCPGISIWTLQHETHFCFGHLIIELETVHGSAGLIAHNSRTPLFWSSLTIPAVDPGMSQIDTSR